MGISNNRSPASLEDLKAELKMEEGLNFPCLSLGVNQSRVMMSSGFCSVLFFI